MNTFFPELCETTLKNGVMKGYIYTLELSTDEHENMDAYDVRIFEEINGNNDVKAQLIEFVDFLIGTQS